MLQPWVADIWPYLTYERQWELLNEYLIACPGWAVLGDELGGELGDAIDELGGKVWACEHGNIAAPNRPCDRCFEDMCPTL
jgi:hypothetical protein